MTWKEGRRMVDLLHFAEQMDCTHCNGLLDLRRTQNENRRGLASVLHILCACGTVNLVHTDRKLKTEEGRNVYLINTVMSGYTQFLGTLPADALKLLQMLRIPNVTSAAFNSKSSSQATETLMHNELSSQQAALSSNHTDSSTSEPTASSETTISASSENLGGEVLCLNENQSDKLSKGAEEDRRNSLSPGLPDIKAETLTLCNVSSSDCFGLGKGSHLQSTGAYLEDVKASVKTSVPFTDGSVDVEAIDMSFSSYAEDDSFPTVSDGDKLLTTNICNSEKSLIVSVCRLGLSAGELPLSITACDRSKCASEFNLTEASSAASDGTQKLLSSCGTEKSLRSTSSKLTSCDMSAVGSLNDTRKSVTLQSSRTGGSTLNSASNLIRDKKNSVSAGIKNSSSKKSRHKCKQHCTKQQKEEPKVPPEEMIKCCLLGAGAGSDSQSQGENQKQGFQCQVCRQQFESELQAYLHIRRHTGTPDLRCFRCGMEFKSRHRDNIKYNLEAHLNKHDNVYPYRCEPCNKRYQSGRQYYQHISQVHNNSKDPSAPIVKAVACEKCDFVTHSRARLTYHMREYHSGRTFVCDLCGKTLARAAGLVNHLKRMHSGEDQARPWQCNVCKKDFRFRMDLVKHRRVHSTTRNHQCQYCSKAFRLKEHLTKHEMIHTGEKPWRCPLCDYAAVQSSSLKWHMKSHVKNSEPETASEKA